MATRMAQTGHGEKEEKRYLHAHDGLLLGGFVAHDDGCGDRQLIKGLRGDWRWRRRWEVEEKISRMKTDEEKFLSRKDKCGFKMRSG